MMAKHENGYIGGYNSSHEKLEITDQEKASVSQFIEQATLLPGGFDQSPEGAKKAFRFLAARKFDVQRSLDLYRVHQRLRHSEGFNAIDPLEEGVRRELLSGKFTILPSRDPSGAGIALFTARLHWPPATTQRDTLKGLILQLDAAVTSEITQRNGIVFIYDMTDSKYSNFDYDLSIKILNMLKGSYPARLRKVLIVTAPLWFRAPFQVLRLFVREKLRDRVYTMDRAHLSQHLELACLPRHLGGRWLSQDHVTWLSKALVSLGHAVPTEYFIAPSPTGSSASSTLVRRASGAGRGAGPSGSSESLATSSRASSWGSSKDTGPEKQGTDETEKTGNGSSTWPLEEEEESDEDRPINGSNNIPRSASKRGKADKDSPERLAAVSQKKRPIAAAWCPPGVPSGPSIHPATDKCGIALTAWADIVAQKGRNMVAKEYLNSILKRKEDRTLDAFKDPKNRAKNRYVDVVCFDESRVKLFAHPTTDYIHANWVDSYRQKNAFICTQGPLPTTVIDFWSMVWMYHVPIIVMTTRTIEGRRQKCCQYWPGFDGDSMEFGSEEFGWQVTVKEVEETVDYRTTVLQMRCRKTGECRQVVHFYFLTWPDHGIPTCAGGFLDFLFAVRDRYRQCIVPHGYSSEMDQEIPPPPIVVHCSAGIGRTGTFITMDILTKRLDDVGKVDITTCVQRIRSQRYGCIQVALQYVFCHRALLEYAVSKSLLPPHAANDALNPSSGESDDD